MNTGRFYYNYILVLTIVLIIWFKDETAETDSVL